MKKKRIIKIQKNNLKLYNETEGLNNFRVCISLIQSISLIKIHFIIKINAWF